jgi:flagellar hook-basal body complex protein FliE
MAITSGAGAYAATQRLFSTGGQAGGLGAGGGAGAVGGDFSAMLERAVGSVAESGRKAEGQAMAAAGGKADLVDVVTAVAESETALQTLVAVRDRVISAYEEIMRMPI